jgi:lipoate-protein ligase A
MSLIIYPFVKGNGPSNMGTDFYLFSNSELKDPIFRNYGWHRNEITFGYGQNWDWVKTQNQINNFPCTRRPTGGGIVNHGNDWTYSLIIPNSHHSFKIPALDLYKFIHASIGNSLNEQRIPTVLQPCPVEGEKRKGIPGDCFREPVGRDLMDRAGNRKIAGAAMKRTKKGILLQGTVDLTRLPEINLEKFSKDFVNEVEKLLSENACIVEWPDHFDDLSKKYSDQFASTAWLKKRK